MKCSACNEAIDVESFLKCTVQGCGKLYHVACTTTTREDSIEVNTWVCQVCRCASKRGGDNSHTPIRNVPSSSNITIRKPNIAVDTLVDDYATEIHLLRKEVSKLTESVAEVLKSLKLYNERLDIIESKVESTGTRLKVLEAQRDTEIAELKATVCELKMEANLHQQTALKNDLEIIGIPESRNENLVHSILTIAKKIGVNLVESDIDGVNRVGPRLGFQDLGDQKFGKPSHRSVVVRLLRKFQRDSLLRAVKSRRDLNTTDLGIDGPLRKIFLNERLTRATRLLFRDARERHKSSSLYKHCWVNGGRIFLRKTDGSPAISIGSQEELERRFSRANHQPQSGTQGENVTSKA